MCAQAAARPSHYIAIHQQISIKLNAMWRDYRNNANSANQSPRAYNNNNGSTKSMSIMVARTWSHTAAPAPQQTNKNNQSDKHVKHSNLLIFANTRHLLGQYDSPGVCCRDWCFCCAFADQHRERPTEFANLNCDLRCKQFHAIVDHSQLDRAASAKLHARKAKLH